MAIKLFVQGGELILESNIVNLKVTSDRKIFSQINGRDTQYQFTGKKTPFGTSLEQKQILLMKLRQKIVDKIQYQRSQDVDKKKVDQTDDETEQKVTPEEDDREEDIEEEEGE